jgi:hypothetical protein
MKIKDYVTHKKYGSGQIKNMYKFKDGEVVIVLFDKGNAHRCVPREQLILYNPIHFGDDDER